MTKVQTDNQLIRREETLQSIQKKTQKWSILCFIILLESLRK